MDKNLVQEFRARINLGNRQTATITAENLERAQETIKRMTNGKARFESPNPNTVVVFHQEWHDGKTPAGYINRHEVPQELSIGTLQDQVAQAA